ncbi:sulfotransferase [Roseovarius sp. Pro17]|uniref:sulfotransferase family protein n=1 Tax=Roseovarius sp. Pro17 TaxID=3108175 RepID=UPI002D77BDCD|nr:sulfotransferase [Roseovarius sp. Pro17]
MDNHLTIANFVYFSKVLRKSGFRNGGLRALQRILDGVSQATRGKRVGPRPILEINPKFEFSLHAIGRAIGLKHYDSCIDQFLNDIILDIDPEGILYIDGLIRPLYTATTRNRDELIEFSRQFLNNLYSKPLEKTGASIWCDDTPLNVLHSSFLLELFPNAAIVHMVRHPMDVFASYMEQTWTPTDYQRTLLRLEKTYSELIQTEKDLGADKLLIIRLEDACDSFEETKRKLSDFCQISQSGFDGSVHFKGNKIGTWREKLPQEVQVAARDRLGFAIEHYGYD